MPAKSGSKLPLSALKIKLYLALMQKKKRAQIEKRQLGLLEKDPDLGGWKKSDEKGFV